MSSTALRGPCGGSLVNRVEMLLAAGLVATVQKGARSHVIPQDPIMLLRRVEAQRQTVQEMLPPLRAVHNSAGGKPKLRDFTGVEGIKRVLEEILDCRSRELRATMANSELFRMPGYETISGVVAKRVKSGVSLRIIRCGPRRRARPVAQFRTRAAHAALRARALR